MKNNLTLFSLLMIALNLNSQTYYEFSEHSGIYEELIPGNKITEHDFNGDTLTELPVQGETFNFFGEDYLFNSTVTLRAQTYGNLRIDKGSDILIFDGVFTVLENIDSSTAVNYRVDGGIGNKIIKVEWRNVHIAAGEANNFCNFQIWIHQKYGVIELRYGAASASNRSGFTSQNGPYAGIFKSDNAFTNMEEKIWLYDDPSMIRVDSTADFSFKRLRGVPAEGTIWRFTPKKYTDSVYIGISDKHQSIINIYPNPVSNKVIIDLNEIKSPITYDLFDSHGKLVNEGIIREKKTKVNLEELPSGLYSIRVNSPFGNIVERIMKVSQ